MADPNTHPWGYSCSNSTDSSTNGTIDIWKPVCGWVHASNDRGTIDILWPSCLTIVLCVWVSTHPNALAPTDRWWHAAIDKFNLAAIGLLGPDFLFGVAVGQLASAKRSVKQFRSDPQVLRGQKWTLKRAFFVDMGGIHLKSPDFEEGFPINAEQLYYLIKYDFVDFPDMKAMAISERNSVDALSRIITVWQAVLFCIKEGDRLRLGLPITPLELTALSFTFVMFATSICWACKPTITYPQYIETKNGLLVKDIRLFARETTHIGLPVGWYRTPLDFISRREFRFDTHWSYYKRLCDMMHLHPFGRPMEKPLWDRIPSDIWMPIGFWLWVFSIFVMAVFSCSFMFGWDFFFPSQTEQHSWRVCATYHMIFSVWGGSYYSFEVWRSHRRPQEYGAVSTSVETGDPEAQRHQSQASELKPEVPRRADSWVVRARSCIGSWRNISHDQNPEMAVPLRVIVPTTVFSALYVFCRVYFYVEDSLSLRVQPQGVYLTGSKILPFLATPSL